MQDMLNRRFRRVLAPAAVALVSLASTSCGDVVRSGRSPVFLTIDLLQGQRGAASPGPAAGTLTSDVITNVRSPAPCTTQAPCPTVFSDGGLVTLRTELKNIGSPEAPTAATSNNDVTITRYRVRYRRADGRNLEGVDVPYGFDGGLTGTVRVGATLQLGFELVRVIAKQETPLIQLRTSPSFIASICDVTFFGEDRVGNEINVTGSILIEFGDFGDF